MKEVIESGQTYIVSDNYPSIPYVKYLKSRGTPESPQSIDDKLEELKTQIDALAKRFEDANIIPKEVA